MIKPWTNIWSSLSHAPEKQMTNCPNKCAQLRKQKLKGAIQEQNNGETALINIEHPLMKEDQKSQSTRPAVQTSIFFFP